MSVFHIKEIIMTHLLAGQSIEFLNSLEDWRNQLPALTIRQAAPDPARVAVAVVDMTEGFCHIGPLPSSRVAGIINPIVTLLRSSWEYGISAMLLTQDNHAPDAMEFNAFPPHCVRGTKEADTIEAIRSLPFYEYMMLVPKNSLFSNFDTGLQAWLDNNPQIDTFIIVGNCTDLFVYQFAMYLRLSANSLQIQRRVIVPANCTATYDRLDSVAREQGGLPHNGDLLHTIFLYHMALNAVEVVAGVL
jgi:nicotinamidase-related amidase